LHQLWLPPLLSGTLESSQRYVWSSLGWYRNTTRTFRSGRPTCRSFASHQGKRPVGAIIAREWTVRPVVLRRVGGRTVRDSRIRLPTWAPAAIMPRVAKGTNNIANTAKPRVWEPAMSSHRQKSLLTLGVPFGLRRQGSSGKSLQHARRRARR
jgi:hypothetical protein